MARKLLYFLALYKILLRPSDVEETGDWCSLEMKYSSANKKQARLLDKEAALLCKERLDLVISSQLRKTHMIQLWKVRYYASCCSVLR